MSTRPSSAELHDLHLDEANRVRTLARQEHKVRERTLLRVVHPLVQEPIPREFQTPIPHRHLAGVVVDHMLAPGTRDDTGFSDGTV